MEEEEEEASWNSVGLRQLKVVSCWLFPSRQHFSIHCKRSEPMEPNRRQGNEMKEEFGKVGGPGQRMGASA